MRRDPGLILAIYLYTLDGAPTQPTPPHFTAIELADTRVLTDQCTASLLTNELLLIIFGYDNNKIRLIILVSNLVVMHKRLPTNDVVWDLVQNTHNVLLVVYQLHHKWHRMYEFLGLIPLL